MINNLIQEGKVVSFKQGDRISRPDSFSRDIYLIKSGIVRVLTMSLEGKGPITIEKLGQGEWIGWSSLLYGKPCEWACATNDVDLVAIDAKIAAGQLWNNHELFNEVINLNHPSIIVKQ